MPAEEHKGTHLAGRPALSQGRGPVLPSRTAPQMAKFERNFPVDQASRNPPHTPHPTPLRFCGETCSFLPPSHLLSKSKKPSPSSPHPNKRLSAGRAIHELGRRRGRTAHPSLSRRLSRGMEGHIPEEARAHSGGGGLGCTPQSQAGRCAQMAKGTRGPARPGSASRAGPAARPGPGSTACLSLDRVSHAPAKERGEPGAPGPAHTDPCRLVFPKRGAGRRSCGVMARHHPSRGRGQRGQPPGSADTRSAPSPVPRPPSPAPLRPGLRSAGQPAVPQHPARSPQRVAAVAATPGRAAEGEGRPSRRPPRSRPPPASARLTSSPGGSARRRRRDKSVQLTLRAGGRRSRGPHHPRPPRRAPLRLLGTPPREPPYYGATKLRSLRAFLRSSLPPSLPPSLPRSRLSPHLPRPPPTTPPPPPTRWVGTTPSQ